MEWHWWENHKLRVVHCPAHRDPLCEVYCEKFSGVVGGERVTTEAGYYPCAVVDGPVEGLLTVLYTQPPWYEETLNISAVKVRFPRAPPPDCERWLAFMRFFCAQPAGPVLHAPSPYPTPALACRRHAAAARLCECSS